VAVNGWLRGRQSLHVDSFCSEVLTMFFLKFELVESIMAQIWIRRVFHLDVHVPKNPF